jgi:hypothetical protein
MGAPAPPSLQPGPSGAGYVASADVAHLAAYQKQPVGVAYWLDERCHKDYADALLPEVGRAVITALDLLFRGRLEIVANDGNLEVHAADVTLGKGRVTLYTDDEKGNRKKLMSAEITGGIDVLLQTPSAAKRVAAVFRGVDAAGEPIVIAREATLP